MHTGQIFQPKDVDLSINLCGITIKNPVMPASGTYDWHPNDGNPLDPEELGAIVTKSITIDVREGNPPPRICEVPQALLNSIGIPSAGLAAYREKYLVPMRGLNTRLITSIAGFSAADFADLSARLDEEDRVDAIELNLSCPNIETDSVFATDVRIMSKIITAARKKTSKPLIAKLSPNVHDIIPFVRAAEEAGSDGLCIANTFTGIAIDIDRMKPILGNVRGGVSGPGTLPIVLKHVWDTAQATHLPIIACGGIFRSEDAIQYFLAGATAVQVGSASYRNPVVMRSIVQGIADYLTKKRLNGVMPLVGKANPKFKGAIKRV